MIESEVSGVLPVTQIKSADWCIAKHLDPFNIEVYCQNKNLLLHKLCYSLHKHVLMSNKVYERYIPFTSTITQKFRYYGTTSLILTAFPVFDI